MNSEILNDIGLGNVDIGYLLLGMFSLILILLILLIVFIVKTNNLKKRYMNFMQGQDAKSLEKDIIGLYEDNRVIKAVHEKHNQDICNLYKKLQPAFQKMGLVRYDAFREMGGQLSFSLALLDECNSGVVINSVHSSDGCYCYAKEIKKGECSIPLSQEEKQALDIAMKGKE